jgi:hypothetical protein
LIKALAKDYNNEINFHEAITNCYRVFSEKTPIEMPDLFELLKLYSSPGWRPSSANGVVSDFDVCLLALVQYLGFQRHQQNIFTCACALPLSGQLPDMTATTSAYIGLQECYQRRASQDRERLTALVKTVLSQVHSEEQSFDWSMIDLVVKNLHGIKSVATSSVASEYGTGNSDGDNVASVIDELCSEPYDDPAQVQRK